MNTSLQALYTESDYAVVSETEGNDCIVSVCNELSDQQKEAISFSGLFQTAAIGFSIRVSPNQAAYYVKATAAELERFFISVGAFVKRQTARIRNAFCRVFRKRTITCRVLTCCYRL